MKKTRISDLWVDGAYQKPERYNLTGPETKRGDEWDIPFTTTEEEEQNEAFLPMMDFFYPLPDFEDQKNYRGFEEYEVKDAVDEAGNITLIKKLKESPASAYGLALTGAGMDFSWDICRGYINLGYLPPIHFCDDIPDFAGMDYEDPRNKIVIAACRRSFDMVKQNADRAIGHLDRLGGKE